MKTLTILFSCFAIQWAVAQHEIFEPRLVAIMTSDIERSMNWYMSTLGFKIERPVKSYPDYDMEIGFLERDNFHLEVLEKANAIDRTQVLKDSENLGGTLKLGFVVNDIDQMYTTLQADGEVDLLTGIGELAAPSIPIEWPSRFFLAKDPDGNLIQFFTFDDKAQMKQGLWLIMITVDQLENAIQWYTEQLGFRHLTTIGEMGNKRAVLERNGCVIELYEPANVLTVNESSEEFYGFPKIAFAIDGLDKIRSELVRKEVKIIHEFSENDFEWASRSLIVKDPEGNWIQLFE